MSRIGNRVLTIPEGVEVSVDGNKVTSAKTNEEALALLTEFGLPFRK